MESKTIQSYFDECIAVLTGIKGALDINSSTCEGCGQESRDNWQEFQAAEALGGAITRIQKAAGLIRSELHESIILKET